MAEYSMTAESWVVRRWSSDGVEVVADLHRGFGTETDAYTRDGVFIGTYSTLSNARRAAIQRYERSRYEAAGVTTS